MAGSVDKEIQVIPYSTQEQQLVDTEPRSAVNSRLDLLLKQFDEIEDQHGSAAANLRLRIAELMIDLDRKDEAWQLARPAVDILVEDGDWQDATTACNLLYLADRDDAIVALGHAVWLGVSAPVEPQLTINLLQHVINETPDDSDGAAVAAATAAYVADLRADIAEDKGLSLFAGRMLADVARSHSHIEAQPEFEAWITRLELDQPDKFLTRLRNVVDVMVQDDWWFSRDNLRARFPDQ